MKRKLINRLLEWKDSPRKKPILLTGAKGVGKTYLIYDFAKTFYENRIYINFETEPYLFDSLFKPDYDTVETAINNYFHITPAETTTLIILDEIAQCHDYLTVLNRLSNETPQYDIVAISSYTSSITCKEQYLHLELFPLDFEEFLISTNNEWYIEVITEHYKANTKIPEIVHGELLDLLEHYLQIGGMPLAVNEYITTGAMFNIAQQHKILLHSYLSEVNQRNSEGEALKICQVYGTISKQLTKANKKFQYTLIRKGATLGLYTEALAYISNSYYGIRCEKVVEEALQGKNVDTAIESILTSVENNIHQNFKLYMIDVGILNTTFQKEVLSYTIHHKKALLENYVAQSLIANGHKINFWESNSQAKIDFIINKNNYLLPIEVKIDDNTRSKNISVFRTRCVEMKHAIKISTKNFDYSNQIKYVPLYAVFCI